MRQIKTVFIRNLNNEDREAIHFAMKETGNNQASKAIMNTVKSHKRMIDLFNSIKDENKRLRIENEKLKSHARSLLSIEKTLKEMVKAE